MPIATSPTLYEKYGGIATITGIVQDFYRRLMARPHLAAYFRNTPLDALIAHQINFIAFVLGGPTPDYADDYLTRAHASHGITREHYAEVVGVLRETLQDAGVEADDLARILARVGALSRNVASRA